MSKPSAIMSRACKKSSYLPNQNSELRRNMLKHGVHVSQMQTTLDKIKKS